jgi:hypothetical protein
MVRTNVPKQITDVKVLAELGKVQTHYHQCANRDCRHVIRCMCRDPGTNPKCRACLGLHMLPNPLSVFGRFDVKECCIGNVVQVPNEYRIHWRLGGSQPWYRCKTCWAINAWPQGAPPTERMGRGEESHG